MVAAAAKAAGASKIIVSDLSEVRLKKALEMGATDVIKSDQEDAVKKIKELVPGGVDVSFEVAGVKPTFDQAIEATKARGTMVIVAIYGHPIEFNPMQLTNTGVKITSTIAYSRETFQQTVDLVTKARWLWNRSSPRKSRSTKWYPMGLKPSPMIRPKQRF